MKGFVFNIAHWPRMEFTSIGRYQSPIKARRAAGIMREASQRIGAGPDRYLQLSAVRAHTVDELIAAHPELVPPGTGIQLVDVDQLAELDVLTEEPTGRRWER